MTLSLSPPPTQEHSLTPSPFAPALLTSNKPTSKSSNSLTLPPPPRTPHHFSLSPHHHHSFITPLRSLYILTNPHSLSHISNKFLRPLLRGRHPKQTLKVFVKMLNEGLNVDRFSFPPLLKAVARAEGLFEGMQVHGLGAKLVFDSDPFLQTGLVEMYAACGRIVDARLVFDKMSYRDVVSWSIMIDGYVGRLMCFWYCLCSGTLL